jgi:two-component system, NarL family, nitrate/nitrite response regulator NarL
MHSRLQDPGGLHELYEEQAGWNVALIIESPIIRIGMEGLLRQVARVASVQSYEPHSLYAALDSAPDIFIFTFDEWRTLGKLAEGIHGRLPPLLVLGDEPHQWSGELFSALPVDGFLSTSQLSVGSAEMSLSRTIAGEMPMTPALARRLLTVNNAQIPGSPVRSVSLTPRESETLALLADGLSNKQIARELRISIHGAKRLVGTILLKLGAPNRTGAVITAQKAGLI